MQDVSERREQSSLKYLLTTYLQHYRASSRLLCTRLSTGGLEPEWVCHVIYVVTSDAASVTHLARPHNSLASTSPHHSRTIPQRLPPRLPLSVRGPDRGSRHKGLRGRVVRVESSHTPQCVSLCLGLPVPPAQLGSPGCRMLTVSYTIAGCCVIYDIDRLPAHPGLACLPAGTADLRKSWVVVRAFSRYCVVR